MLSEISQAVRDKYHMISPLTGTQSIEEKSKQNIINVFSFFLRRTLFAPPEGNNSPSLREMRGPTIDTSHICMHL